MNEENKELVPQADVALTGQPAETALAEQQEVHGFEESRAEDQLIPRIKVINALSPERVDGICQEGDVINSLTQEDCKNRRFIPIRQYYSNIEWNPDRGSETRIFCRSADGRIGVNDMGSCSCASCGKNKFDNTKTGKDAQPTCTAYMNFLGFFEGNPMPVVLSFSRTNYNEGRKLLSIAKSMRQSIWNFAYTIDTKKVTKDRNTWFTPIISMAGATSVEERALAAEMFKAFESQVINADYEESTAAATVATDADTEAEL